MTVDVNRRAVLGAAALASASLALPQIMVRAASAAVPIADAQNSGFNRFKFGEFQVTTILDGLRPGDGPHPIFGQNQSAEAVAELMEANLLPTNKFVNSFTPILVNTGSELILFDTGLGAGARENGMGQLASRMAASGYKPEDVTVVVISHMHGDHIGGLMENGAPAFANARYVMGQAEYDFWTAPERMSGPTVGGAKAVAANVKPLAEKTTFVGDGGEVVSGLGAMLAAGHTPGHLIFTVESGGKTLVLTADTANHYVASLQRPDWHVQFDADKDMAAATRRKVFDMIATDRLPFIGYHMPFPAVGYVEKLETGYRYVPETYQLDL
ncbi:MBL fold metallo-hydrolase [Pseudaminobacter sp. 19-2017]|uniref:MBL fold metallo-hydrolase n=1 Tax=Pseudaminobacter soli (ex Zhang et al. 2022) TaxID=2831468 RepID=A0A942I9D7_9HYPH|nr:MBL fold metallo-hydrolase [Pseudaminobacter soli]MBS3649236.1 MBL fold metallo-hydrolase [Pseudaminobacter soli]